ncbi:MAG TPA: hypothetical protein VIK14_01460 [Ignavibacteria bacterium]
METVQRTQLLNNVDKISVEENLSEEDKTKMTELIKKAIDYTGSSIERVPWIYGIVVTSLGLVVILSVVFASILALNGKSDTPQILIALGSTSVGALAGLLAPSPKEK